MADSNLAEQERDSRVNAEEYLTFMMGGEEFGVDILLVQEIRGWQAVTPIPNAPAHVVGVMNLRGTIVPVVDLRAYLGSGANVYGDKTVVIIINIESDAGAGAKTVGVVADAVMDVENFFEDDLQTSGELSERYNLSYVKGLGQTSEKVVVLLSLDESILFEHH